MMTQINEKFIDLFNTMGCKGEVCLDVPESSVSYSFSFVLNKKKPKVEYILARL